MKNDNGLIFDVRSPNSGYIKFPNGCIICFDAGSKSEIILSMWNDTTPEDNCEFSLIYNRDNPSKSTLDILEEGVIGFTL